MRNIKFRYILSLLFLIIALALIGILIWIIGYHDSREYGGFRSILFTWSPFFILSLILSFIFYKFNKLWARSLFYFLLCLLVLFYFFNSYIYEKIYPNSGNGFIELPGRPNLSLPRNCLIMASIGDSKSISMPPINCAGDNCFGDIALTPIKIINSADTEVKSSSSCSVLNGTNQYVEILSDGIENGQKVQAEIDYGKKIKNQNTYYLYKLINVTIVDDK